MQLRNDQLWLSPSDVTGFLVCEHLTTLQLRVARGVLEKAVVENEQAELIFRKGLEHEAAFLAQLLAGGKSVTEISLEPDLDWERAQRETLDAMRSGVDVVYQAVFVDGAWRGVADFLLRTETPSVLGPWSYEALDTKPSSHAEARNHRERGLGLCGCPRCRSPAACLPAIFADVHWGCEATRMASPRALSGGER